MARTDNHQLLKGGSGSPNTEGGGRTVFELQEGWGGQDEKVFDGEVLDRRCSRKIAFDVERGEKGLHMKL